MTQNNATTPTDLKPIDIRAAKQVENIIKHINNSVEQLSDAMYKIRGCSLVSREDNVELQELFLQTQKQLLKMKLTILYGKHD